MGKASKQYQQEVQQAMIEDFQAWQKILNDVLSNIDTSYSIHS